MTAVDPSTISKEEHDELCCVYAALILHDAGIEITVTSYSDSTRKTKSQSLSKPVAIKLNLTIL